MMQRGALARRWFGLRIAVVRVVVVATMALSSSVLADANATVTEGKAAFTAGDYAAAYRLFRAAADEDASHPTALYNAALAARKAGLMVEAGGAYRDMLKRSPDDLDVVYGLAEVERALGHTDEARHLYQRYLDNEHRPERADLRSRAEDGLMALPTPTPSVDAAPPSTPPPTLPPPLAAVSPARQAEAALLFNEAMALAQAGDFAMAATRFMTAAQRDPQRVDALLKAGLNYRRAGTLSPARAAYQSAIDHADADGGQRLDGTYGLGETLRLAGDAPGAIAAFTRYINGETRPSEVRFVERARIAIAELTGPVPVVAVPPPLVAASPASLVAVSPTPPPVAVPSPAVTALPPSLVVVSPTPPPVAAPVAAPVVVSALPTPPPPPSVAFFGDRVIVDSLVARAKARADAGDAAGGAAAAARARSLAPGDARTAPSTTPACDADAAITDGEAALGHGDGPAGLVAFRRARACDPTRSAPLWGLSRAFDAVGDRSEARRFATLYVNDQGPDHDPVAARAAFFRSETP